MAQSPGGGAAAPDLSPFKPRDSQACDGCFDPLSFPSQPPDISNWFSSYVYESPESLGLPDGLGSSVLHEEDETETQDPMDSSSRRKTQVPPTSKDNLIGLAMHARNSYHSSTKANSFMLKENQNSLLQVGGKPYGGNDDSYSGYSNCGLQVPRQWSNEASASSAENLLERSKNKEQVSHHKHLRELNPFLQENGSNPGVNCDICREQSLPQHSVQKEAFISVKNKSSSRANDQSWPSKFASKVDFGYPASNEGDPSDNLRMLPDEQSDCSNRNKNVGDRQIELLRETTNAQTKRKLDLKKLLGEELLGNHSEENGTGLFLSASDQCLSKDSECFHLGQNKGCERINRENWLRDGDKVSVGNTEKKQEDGSHQDEQLFLKNNAEEPKGLSGFISTKNRDNSREECCILRPNSISSMHYEDVVSKTAMTSKEAHEHSRLQNKNGTLTEKGQAQGEHRSPLADKSNYQVAVAASEISGKWRCPRKTKTDMGPPRKQLRLDRWFHLVNGHSTMT